MIIPRICSQLTGLLQKTVAQIYRRHFCSSSSSFLLVLLLRLRSRCSAPLFCKKIRRQLRLYRRFFIFPTSSFVGSLVFILDNFLLFAMPQYRECLLYFAFQYLFKKFQHYFEVGNQTDESHLKCNTTRRFRETSLAKFI